jgi:hypothetical protein
MKKIERKDLIDNEIYICFVKVLNKKYLIKKANNFVCTNIEMSPLKNQLFHYGGFGNITNEFYEATPEEKHWLEECIKADKFISYEEAMKTFVPEYVECIKELTGINYGKILPIKNNIVIDGMFNNYSMKADDIYNYFKPSTKEAYDAQFVVKEPEFVLPEKWAIKNTNKIISDYFNIMTNSHNIYNDSIQINKYLHSHNSSGAKLGATYLYSFSSCKIRENHVEITFDQFKKYVLKEELEEPKDKVLKQTTGGLSKITKVESSEGAVFELGDKITVFTKDSPNKGKVLTIKGFRWNNAKTNICTITEVHVKNGIGLDKIELYSEPVKKELSLIEQAKLKYPIGTKVKSLTSHICIITQQSYINLRNSDGYCKNTDSIWFTASPYSPLIYRKGQWAEIVEDFKLPETWWITIENERQLEIAKQYSGKLFTFNNDLKIGSSIAYCIGLNKILGNYKNLSNITKSRNPQITFEQFEQYVLHNGFKIGDRFTKQKYLYNSRIAEVGEKEIIDLQYINSQSVAFYKIVENGHTAPYFRILTKNIVR